MDSKYFGRNYNALADTSVHTEAWRAFVKLLMYVSNDVGIPAVKFTVGECVQQGVPRGLLYSTSFNKCFDYLQVFIYNIPYSKGQLIYPFNIK